MYTNQTRRSCEIVEMFGKCVYLVLFLLNVSGFPQKNVAHEETEPQSYKLYSRADWGAKLSTDERPLKTPVPYVIIHHTAIPLACNTTEECMADMRSMQSYHQGLGWGDIGYNFCIGNDGSAYEGRGWRWIGIHAGKANSLSVGICLIGDWRVDEPPAAMLQTAKELIRDGIMRGVISPSYRLMGHGQVMSTECPGTRLLNEISTWNNYWPGQFDSSHHAHLVKEYSSIRLCECGGELLILAVAKCRHNNSAMLMLVLPVFSAIMLGVFAVPPPTLASIDPEENEVITYDFPFVSRAGWQARTPTKRAPLSVPVEYVVLHHSYTPAACSDRAGCARAMRSMQDFHMDDRGWCDVGYNFGVGGDGVAYEGRGWDTLGAHALHFNTVSLGICIIGDWTDSLPPAEQLKTVKALIEAGISQGYIKPDYKIVGHRQVRDTKCPGQALFEEIKTWPHYSKYPASPDDLVDMKLVKVAS
ncbi:peptidoglycan-recognition protein LF-like [Aricia agestis]|uniref:peptidoglycan-recognition protein LF-like n=1 Tax=Aricia agestis TaxID=91739 RepID=UPI001C20623D|nr:peptidoglycan-recognition protein LF-like [Aricia agestis]